MKYVWKILGDMDPRLHTGLVSLQIDVDCPLNVLSLIIKATNYESYPDVCWLVKISELYGRNHKLD